MKFIVLLFIFSTSLWGDIKSTDGNINFDVNNDAQAEMILNSTGLGIGIVPSSNLQVQGNTIISQQLHIGQATNNANLYISGTLGFNIENITSNVILIDSSIYLANTSTANGNLWLDLPYAGNVTGRSITIKKYSNDFRVTVTTSTNIDQSTSIVLSTSSGMTPTATVLSDGSNWHLLNYLNETNNSTRPTEISGLALWLDANHGDSLTYGTTGNVSAANDLSGNDRHATQASSDRQPFYIKKAIHGLPAFRCDNDQLDITSGLGIAADADRTLIFVLKPESGHNNSEVFGTGTGTMVDLGNYSLDNRLRLRDNGHDNDIYSSAGDAPFDQSNLITITATSGNTQAYRGDTQIISSANEHSHYSLAGSVGIAGANFDGRRFKGDLGEVIIYSKVLSLNELTQIWSYLSKKWGIPL